MKFLALDYGRKKIGVALSDGLGSMAFAKYVLQYSSVSRVIDDIVKICEDNRIEGIVVGLPLYRDGSISPLAREVYSFITKLYTRFTADYFTINEYLSSFAAKDIAPSSMKEPYLDAYSAKIILEDFLSLSEEQRLACQFSGEV